MRSDPNRVFSFGVDYAGITKDIEARDNLRDRDDNGLIDWDHSSVWFLDSDEPSHRDFDWIESKSVAIGFHTLNHQNFTQSITTSYVNGDIELEDFYQKFYRTPFSIFSYKGHRTYHNPLGGAMMLRETNHLIFPSCSSMVIGQDCVIGTKIELNMFSPPFFMLSSWKS